MSQKYGLQRSRFESMEGLFKNVLTKKSEIESLDANV